MRENTFLFKKTYLAAAIFCCCAVPAVQASDIHLSGFISVGGGLVDDKNGVAYNGYSEDDLTFNKNLLGLQVEGKVSDKLTATAQVIARSANEYQMNNEWAYLSWQVADNTKIRAGRLRTPFYMFSDSLDVGYSYAWITPPTEVYSVPFNNVDGIDVYNTATVGPFDTTLQAYFGSFESETELNDTPSLVKTRNQMGLAATIGKDWWTIRAAYHQSDLTIENASFTYMTLVLDENFKPAGADSSELLADGDKTTFAEIGLNIDTGKFVFIAEHTELEAKHSFVARSFREYVMGGVRVDDFLFHLTAARSKDKMSKADPIGNIPYNSSTSPLLDGIAAAFASGVNRQNVVTLGTRWDVTAGTALKLELSSVKLAGHDPDKTKEERSQKVLAVAVQTVF